MKTKSPDRRDQERRRGTALDRLERVFGEAAARLLIERRAHERAAARARRAMTEVGPNPRASGVILLDYAADLLVAEAVELVARPGELRWLLSELDGVTALPRSALARRVLGDPRLLRLPAGVSLEVLVGLLMALADCRAVSVWTREGGRTLKRRAAAGEFQAVAGDSRRMARALLGKQQKAVRIRGLIALPIEVHSRRIAAVVVQGRKGAGTIRRPILEAASPLLAAMLERDQLLPRGKPAPEAVAAAAERRLSRLRFDLHDGPQQDVVLLAEDLRLLRSQLEAVLKSQPNKARILGRLDDLEARLVAIDGDLRRISAFVQSPFLQSGSVPESLNRLTDEFAARAGIEPKVELDGDFSGLSDSQQITLLGLIREALSNVREHSRARHVTVRLSAGPNGVAATISDDGAGFDPETTLVEAARRGHLGLVGMHERVQMLGGVTHIDSRPGGPTVISVNLPRFTG